MANGKTVIEPSCLNGSATAPVSPINLAYGWISEAIDTRYLGFIFFQIGVTTAAAAGQWFVQGRQEIRSMNQAMPESQQPPWRPLNVSPAMLVAGASVDFQANLTDVPGRLRVVWAPTVAVVIQDLTYVPVASTATGAATPVTIAYVDGGAAAPTVVSVVGTAISISFESGVTDADAIKAAFDAEPDAVALATVTVSGTGSDPQTAPVAATPLAGGAGTANVFYNGQER